VPIEVCLGYGVFYLAWQGLSSQKRFMNEDSTRSAAVAFRHIPAIASRMLVMDAALGFWAVGWTLLAFVFLALQRRPLAGPFEIPRPFQLAIVALFGFHVYRVFTSDRPRRGTLGIFLAGVGDDSGYAFWTHFTLDIWLTSLALCSVALALCVSGGYLVSNLLSISGRPFFLWASRVLLVAVFVVGIWSLVEFWRI
jgi:hypothetical protein